MKKSGFSLLLAIVIMITVATLMAFMMTVSTSGVKRTSDIYAYEQVKFIAKTAQKMAILALKKYKNSKTCLENMRFSYLENFSVQISFYYIGKNLSCHKYYILDDNISTAESNLTAIIDTTVIFNASSEPVRYHIRTIQKP